MKEDHTEVLRKEDIEILKPDIKDLDAVFDLWYAQHELHYNLDPDYYWPNMPNRRTTSVLSVLARQYFEKAIKDEYPNNKILIAKLEGKIVGFITYNEHHVEQGQIERFATQYSTYVEVIDLFVDEQTRGRNIGAHLMSKVEDYCREVGMQNMKVEVAAPNTRAQHFYERLGFAPKQVEMFKFIPPSTPISSSPPPDKIVG